MQVVKIRHAIGAGRVDLGAMNLGMMGRGSESHKPTIVKYDGSIYLVGDHVEDYAPIRQGFDTSRLYSGSDLPTLTYACLASLLGDRGGASIDRVTAGLPVETMLSKQAGRYKSAIEKKLKGVHKFEVNDVAYEVDINYVTCLPQPSGTHFAWALDANGKARQSEEALASKIAIADVGFMSTDLVSIQGSKFLGVHTGGCMGMQAAILKVQAELNNQHNVDYPPPIIDEMIRNPGVVWLGTGKVDITGIVERAKADAANQIIGYMKKKWGNGYQFSHLFVVGGGAHALGEYIINEYPTGVVPKDPDTRNAIGLCKYTRRFSSGTVLGLDLGQGYYKAAISYE